MSTKLKVVAISDTHGWHRHLTLPSGDVLVHCGDICRHGNLHEVRDFTEWLEDQPYKHKIIVAGNHDGSIEQRTTAAREYLTNAGAHLLLNEAVVIEGVKFWGSPITPTFFNWAFMRDRGHPIAAVWKEIPEDVDVLITHGPPYGHGDLAPAYRTAHPKVAGCLDLLNRIREIHQATGGRYPRVHVFGHIHDGYGATMSDLFDGLVFLNAATCTEAYRPEHPPIVFDIAKRE